jgi:predicted glycosyltransferase
MFREIPDFDLINKLHPDNDYELYREHFSKWDPPHTAHLVKDEFSPRELLSISKVFMTVYSTMALESLVYGIPVITLDYTPVKFHLNLEPAINRAKSPSELKKILNNWNDKTSILMKDKIKETLDCQLANLGFASEKAAKAILKLAKIPS